MVPRHGRREGRRRRGARCATRVQDGRLCLCVGLGWPPIDPRRLLACLSGRAVVRLFVAIEQMSCWGALMDGSTGWLGLALLDANHFDFGTRELAYKRMAT